MQTYLENVRQVNNVRNMLGFTGELKWNDKGGGIRIYIHELYNFYDVEVIIRVGTTCRSW